MLFAACAVLRRPVNGVSKQCFKFRLEIKFVEKVCERNPFSPDSTQKRPEPQIGPKFVRRLFFGVPVWGTEICQNLSENYHF